MCIRDRQRTYLITIKVYQTLCRLSRSRSRRNFHFYANFYCCRIRTSSSLQKRDANRSSRLLISVIISSEFQQLSVLNKFTVFAEEISSCREKSVCMGCAECIVGVLYCFKAAVDEVVAAVCALNKSFCNCNTVFVVADISVIFEGKSVLDYEFAVFAEEVSACREESVCLCCAERIPCVRCV